VLQQARAAAERLLADQSLDDAGRITRAFRLCLGRLPSAAERKIAEAFLQTADAKHKADAWAQFMQTLFASMEFRYVN